MKPCNRCNVIKALTEFYRDERYSGGYRPQCKSCHSKDARARYNAQNPDRPIKTPLESMTDGEKKRYRLNANLKSNYKMTVEQYETRVSEQRGLCAICKQSPLGERLLVDHDHLCCSGTKSCGKCVRQLLCRNCNTGLSRFRDNPVFLQAAIDYLGKDE